MNKKPRAEEKTGFFVFKVRAIARMSVNRGNYIIITALFQCFRGINNFSVLTELEVNIHRAKEFFLKKSVS
jgi:hypothetical protein